MTANTEYALWLKKLCGENGDGGDGKVPFPTKHRPPKNGGDWDMKASIEKRPLAAAGKSIYEQGAKITKLANNRYNPLLKVCLDDNGQLRSGWTEERLEHCMLYNMYVQFEAARWVSDDDEREDDEEEEEEEEEGEEGAEGEEAGAAHGARRPKRKKTSPTGLNLGRVDTTPSVFESETMHTMRAYAAKHELFWSAWLAFGPRGDNSPWLTTQPPMPNRDTGTTRDQQRDRANDRRADRANVEAGQPDLTTASQQARRELEDNATKRQRVQTLGQQQAVEEARAYYELMKELGTSEECEEAKKAYVALIRPTGAGGTKKVESIEEIKAAMLASASPAPATGVPTGGKRPAGPGGRNNTPPPQAQQRPPPPPPRERPPLLPHEKMAQWWELNGGQMIAGETPESLATHNSLRQHRAAELRSEFMAEFSKDLVHLSDEILRQMRDGAFLLQMKKEAQRQARAGEGGSS